MPAVPFSCGSSAAQAWGRASRAASRLASAWRMTGSLCTASSNTPTRSLAGAAPENASNAGASSASARVEARFMTFPSFELRLLVFGQKVNPAGRTACTSGSITVSNRLSVLQARRDEAAAGPDLQHGLAGLRQQRLQEPAGHAGAQHMLPARQRHLDIGIGAVALRGRDKQLAGYPAHDLEHTSVQHVPRAHLLLDHLFAGIGGVHRLASELDLLLVR